MSQLIPLEVVEYTDSWFTRAHDVVSPAPVKDGRGTFTHVGVRMEGLESGRHLNFRAEQSSDNSMVWFERDPTHVNIILLRVQKFPSQLATVHELILDTSFYTRNHTHSIYSVEALMHSPDGLLLSHTVIVSDLHLEGDRRHVIPLAQPVILTALRLRVGEGGLARIQLKGSLSEAETKGLGLRNVLSPACHIFGASDASYGDPRLVLRPERQGDVMAGWESCRHSCRHRLGIRFESPLTAPIEQVEVDTYLHCLNPFRYLCILAAAASSELTEDELLLRLPSWKVKDEVNGTELKMADHDLNAHVNLIQQRHPMEKQRVKYSLDICSFENEPWKVLLPMTPLRPDTLHTFRLDAQQLRDVGLGVTHVMVLGVPDGGLYRLGIQIKQ